MTDTRFLFRHAAYGLGLGLTVLGFVPSALSAQQKAASAYAGSASCLDCHKKMAAPFLESAKGQQLMGRPRTEHEKKGCESCHGPSKQHANSGGEERGDMIVYSRKSPTPVTERNAICLQCHQKTARTLWKGSAHEARNVACTDCHVVMHHESERGALKKSSVAATCGSCHQQKVAAIQKNSHMPLGEQKMECTSCHNPHGSPNEKLLIKSSVSETCYQCHQEKRGPFLWQHIPVAESCANCHDSHGSNKEKMLKLSRPRLCQQCHPTGHGGPVARATDAAAVRFTYNKSCSNCHVNIHGSNHTAGAFFTR